MAFSEGELKLELQMRGAHFSYEPMSFCKMRSYRDASTDIFYTKQPISVSSSHF